MPHVREPRVAKPNALLLILCAATFMSSLDLFIVNVGLRAIGQDVGQSSLAHLSWILNAYAIVFAALLVPAGRLADRYGNKLAFMVGLSLFTLGSIGCASSSDLWLIVGLRCLQAIGAAALVPSSLGLILTAIPLERRKQSIQIWAVSGSLGAAAGPTLGGLLVQLSWRWIFLVNVPIGASALVSAALLAPNLKHSVETRMPDLLGGLLLILAVGSLALALEQGSSWGWGSSSAIICFALSAGSLILFVARSARHEAPVMPLGLFRHREFTWANVAVVMISIAFAMQLLGLVLWLQEAWGWSALRTGLGIAPGPAVVSVTAIGLRRFTAPLPAGIVAAVGALVISAGGALIAGTLGTTPNYAGEVLPGWLIIGAGVGLALPTIIAAGTARLAAHQASTGSAVVQMNRQIGSVLGVALLVVLLGSSAAASTNLHSFTEAWWWASCFAVVAAVSALGITPRGKEITAGTSRASAPLQSSDPRTATGAGPRAVE
jgi:EmrB/QacA subfamily drug resistance transporter